MKKLVIFITLLPQFEKDYRYLILMGCPQFFAISLSPTRDHITDEKKIKNLHFKNVHVPYTRDHITNANF